MPQSSLKRFVQSSPKPLPVHPRYRAALFAVLLFLFSPPLLAQESPGERYQTRYADILYTREQDLRSFTSDIGQGLSLWTESPRKNPVLTQHRVDGIVDSVIKLLDMRPVTLRFSIRLYRRQTDLEQAYRRIGVLREVPAAFYSHQSRTISVSLDNISARMLAHEIAHAVICAYFSAPPPARMQEILAQYVDEHLGE